MNKNLIFIFLVLFVLFFKGYYIFKSANTGNYTYEHQLSNGDAGHYLKIAENLKIYNVFSDDYSGTPSMSATYRPPLWPLALSMYLNISSDLLYVLLFKNLTIAALIFLVFYLFKNKIKINDSKYFLYFPLLLLLEPHINKYNLTFLTEDFTAAWIIFLSILFINLNEKNLSYIGVGVLSVVVFLWHPISVFFIFLIIVMSFLKLFKHSKLKSIALLLLFVSGCLLWPLRNALVFKTKPYVTISQGPAFAKGWNDSVITQFTNVDGDLADETLNFKYIDKDELNSISNGYERSQLMTKATLKFLGSSSVSDILKISSTKLLSNFNPFPEKPKPGFLESLGTLFRVLYLLLFLEIAILWLFFKDRLNQLKKAEVLLVLVIFTSQIITSIIFYTGLRFNTIYTLTLLYLLIKINFDLFKSLKLTP
ncbi:MAG: hypothetical protein RQ735_01870 [Flavobacteriaceae bacterium]|nr:hypothetical protein [Flavobacteriaceae bacterium]